MNRHEAARRLGVAYKDVLGVEQVEHGTVVYLRDDGERIIRPEGVYGWGEHPKAARLPQYSPPVEPAAPEPEEQPEQEAAKPARKPGRPRKVGA